MARAFEMILFKGQVGVTYNIGGTNERQNIEVAKDLIRLAGYSGRESEMMTFVEDRCFNDLRYHINSDRLIELGNNNSISRNNNSIMLCVCTSSIPTTIDSCDLTTNSVKQGTLDETCRCTSPSCITYLSCYSHESNLTIA